MKNGLTKQQQGLLYFPGDDYSVKVIDQAACVYRDLGDHDIEVIGGCTRRDKFHVFLWQRKPYLEVVERYLDIPHNFDRVARIAAELTRRYLGKRGASV